MSLDKLGYYWDQTEQEVRIYLSLEAASPDDLTCDFSNRSCALSAVVDDQRCVAFTHAAEQGLSMRLRIAAPQH